MDDEPPRRGQCLLTGERPIAPLPHTSITRIGSRVRRVRNDRAIATTRCPLNCRVLNASGKGVGSAIQRLMEAPAEFIFVFSQFTRQLNRQNPMFSTP